MDGRWLRNRGQYLMRFGRHFVPPPAIVLVVLMAFTLCGLFFSRLYGWLPPSLQLYFVTPIVLGGLALVARILYGDSVAGRIRHRRERQQLVASVMVVWFVVYFCSGLLTTYTTNTLAASISGIVLNIVAFGTAAMALEYVRYVTLTVAGRRNVVWFGVVVAVVYSFALSSLDRLVGAGSVAAFIEAFIAYGLPALSTSLVATYLVVTSGLGAAWVFRLGIVLITVVPPIIPKYDWYMTGVSVLMLAIAIFLTLDHASKGQHEERRVRHFRVIHRLADGGMVVVIVALIAFMTGVFSYRPLAIVSNSMQPVFARGSMVVVQSRTPSMDIQIGDIVQYEGNERMITHRVVAIETARDGEEPTYITQGDNSPSIDPPVSSSQIRGVIRASIPLIGYPTVWLHELSK